MGKKLFGNNIEPSCQTCSLGRPAPDEIMILCRRFGPVAPSYRCLRYKYDPLRRIPKKQPKLPEYSPEDFQID